MTFIVSIVVWPLILVAFAFLVAAIVMLCIPDQRPPQVWCNRCRCGGTGDSGGTTDSESGPFESNA